MSMASNIPAAFFLIATLLQRLISDSTCPIVESVNANRAEDLPKQVMISFDLHPARHEQNEWGGHLTRWRHEIFLRLLCAEGLLMVYMG